ncbi:hypothetical protein FV219_10825 [Methylobacterium sp. WL122]|nr:hypothetical protein FV219_10825 [Methylobacterium sp. WL122]
MMSDEAKTPKKGGRPAKGSGEGKSPTITFRCRPPLLAQVHAAAQTAHRSISEEVERRLEDSYVAEAKAQEQTNLIILAAKGVVFDVLYEHVGGKENFEAGRMFAHALKTFQAEADAKFRADDPWYSDADKRRYVTDRALEITKDIVAELVRGLDPGAEERRERDRKALAAAANAGMGALGSLGLGLYDPQASFAPRDGGDTQSEK